MLPTNLVLDIAHQNFHMLGSRQGFAVPFPVDQSKFNTKLVSDSSHTCNMIISTPTAENRGRRRNDEC